MAFKKSVGLGKSGPMQCNNFYPNHISMEIRQDLVDCEIAICDCQVLSQFADNFDKLSLKDDYINWLYETDVI